MQSGASAAGAIRELGEALVSGPFRIALVLSVIAHVALLVGLRDKEDAPRRLPLVRVHFVREAPVTPVPPTAASRPQRVDRQVSPGRAKTGEAVIAAEERALQPATRPADPLPAADPAPVPAAAPPTGSPVPPAPKAPASLQESVPPLRPVEKSEAVPENPREAPADVVPGPASLRREATAAAEVAATAATGTDGATSAVVAGAGGVAGRTDGAEPAGARAATGDVAPGPAPAPTPQEIAGLRRRIDARKIYPQMAVRNGWEGRVLVEMHLDLEGRLAGVRLVASSGYAILDDATITAVRHASPFPPVARVVTVPVEYRLVP